jgi:hypothetical protein
MIELWNKCLVLPVIAIFLVVSPTISCASASGMQVLNHQLTPREFTGDLNQTRAMAVVSGAVKNINAEPIRYCAVKITFYDAERNNIGVAVSTRESMGPGEIWNFTVQLTNSDAWKARSYTIDTSNR